MVRTHAPLASDCGDHHHGHSMGLVSRLHAQSGLDSTGVPAADTLPQVSMTGSTLCSVMPPIEAYAWRLMLLTLK